MLQVIPLFVYKFLQFGIRLCQIRHHKHLTSCTVCTVNSIWRIFHRIAFLWLHMKLAAGVQINIRRRFAMGDLPGRNNVVEIVIQSHSLQQTAAALHTSCGGNRCTHTFLHKYFNSSSAPGFASIGPSSST